MQHGCHARLNPFTTVAAHGVLSCTLHHLKGPFGRTTLSIPASAVRTFCEQWKHIHVARQVSADPTSPGRRGPSSLVHVLPAVCGLGATGASTARAFQGRHPRTSSWSEAGHGSFLLEKTRPSHQSFPATAQPQGGSNDLEYFVAPVPGPRSFRSTWLDGDRKRSLR